MYILKISIKIIEIPSGLRMSTALFYYTLNGRNEKGKVITKKKGGGLF